MDESHRHLYAMGNATEDVREVAELSSFLSSLIAPQSEIGSRSNDDRTLAFCTAFRDGFRSVTLEN